MSAGGVFALIANDGGIDAILMATKLLNARIADIICARRNAGNADLTPSLNDLQRTHILYVTAVFKPFVAIAFEYNKVRSSTGAGNLGSSIQFSIPQFGDFFHDMVLRTRLSACQSATLSTPAQSTGTPTAPAIFPFNGTTATGTAAANLTYNIVDVHGVQLVAGDDDIAANPVQYRNYVRYCEYPANRLLQNVKFDVNGNPLDEYGSVVACMLEKFCVAPNKRTGHDRLLGQEVPMTGYSGLYTAAVTDADALTPANTITKFTTGQSQQTPGLYHLATGQVAPIVDGGASTATVAAPLGSVLGAQTDISRQMYQFVNGPQTPKPIQPPLELWSKLRFWFNDDVRLAIASVSIPYGMRFITMEFATAAQLVYEFPSIYLETVEDPVTGPPDGGPVALRRKTYTPIFQLSSVTPPTVTNCELYINNIFVNPEIHDIYIRRIGFTLIRVYRVHTQRSNADGTDEKLLSQLKWPIEYMFVGLRPTWNIRDAATGAGGLVSAGNQNQWRDWHRFTRVVDASVDTPCLAEVPSGTRRAASGSSISKVVPDHYYLTVPTVDTLSLSSHGIPIYDGFADTFYNQYMPFHYGGMALNTPDDPGVLFVNMSLFPRSYQPSGHLNISRARETYIKWTTSYVSANTPAELYAVAVAINFLLITDGSAVLRYST